MLGRVGSLLGIKSIESDVEYVVRCENRNELSGIPRNVFPIPFHVLPPKRLITAMWSSCEKFPYKHNYPALAQVPLASTQ